MKPIPAGQILTEFGAKAKPAATPNPTTSEQLPRSLADRGDKQMFRHQDASAENNRKPLVDKAMALEEAHARGFEEGQEAALAEVEAQLVELRNFYETQHELERSMWVSREADKVADQLNEGLQAIKTEIAERTARILKSFLTERIHRQAMDSLWEALETLLSHDRGVTLEISGREDFLQLLREKLSELKTAAVFTPSESVEVRVRVGQTVMETQLGAWLARLEELVKDRRRRVLTE